MQGIDPVILPEATEVTRASARPHFRCAASLLPGLPSARSRGAAIGWLIAWASAQ